MTMPTRPHRLTALVAAMTVLIAAPIAVSASHRFDDVSDSNTFHRDIAWLADADVTRGCNPPANTQFCPDDNVTRGQMAAFMNRLANNRVVHAATAQDAEQLDGQDSIAFTTEVWAANCGLEPDSGGNPVSNCLPDTDNSVETVEAVFTLEIDAPAAGSLQLMSMTQSGGPMLFNFTIDEMCSENPLGFVVAGVNGQSWGSAATAATGTGFTTTAVSAGSHTIRLCALNADDIFATPVGMASLTAVWTAGGTVSAGT